MKILLLGSEGQLGKEISKTFEELNLIQYTRENLDLESSDIKEKIISISPNIVINCAAYTNVDGAENDKKQAYKVNSQALRDLSNATQEINCKFVHFSTDYVFSGDSKTPYKEGSPTNPKTIYGKSKLEGENFINEFSTNFLIFRVGWLYSSNGNNFVKKIILKHKEDAKLKIVNDQFGTPTSASFVAKTLKEVFEHKNFWHKNGVYHLSCNGKANWYEFTTSIFEYIKKDNPNFILKEIKSCKSSEYETNAIRPFFSVLNCNKIKKDFNIEIPSWKKDLKSQIQDIYESTQ